MLEQVFDFSQGLGFDTVLLLVVLVALEAVLSADNAIALASISKTLDDGKLQRQALNIGLAIAFLFRIGLILTATWVIQFWQFELLGALYLLWLVFQYFTTSEDGEDEGFLHHHHTSLWQVIPAIAMTDLAFSLDSVTAAIGVSEKTWLVVTGATLGIITLRLMAGLFIRWLKEFTHLETAGYVTVGLVGLKLLLRVIDHSLVPPEWMLVVAIVVLFTWGFSERTPIPETENVNLSNAIQPHPAEPQREMEGARK